MSDDERKVEPLTAAITLAAVVAGVVLVTQGHEGWAGVCFAYAFGGATLKPLMRPDR